MRAISAEVNKMYTQKQKQEIVALVQQMEDKANAGCPHSYNSNK